MSQILIAKASVDLCLDRLDDVAWSSAPRSVVEHYWSGEAVPEGRRFDVRMLWSDEHLYVRFECEQSEPLTVSAEPVLDRKTMRLWDRDVCELFLAPDKDEPRRYAEFEIAPTGEWLDLMVDWTKDEPRDWDYASGMECWTSSGEGTVTMAFRVPWITGFGRRPAIGEVWLGNIFRQVGSGETRGYLAWQPTMTEMPNFHVPDAFGEFHFVE